MTKKQLFWQLVDELCLMVGVGKYKGKNFYIFSVYDNLEELQKRLFPRFKQSYPGELSKLSELLGQWGYDEDWGYCDECRKVFRISPDSYSFIPDFAFLGEGRVCGDCIRKHPEEYIQTLLNNSNNANTILKPQDLKKSGFTLVEGDLEAGYYDKYNDPTAILKEYQSYGDSRNKEFIFSIDYTEQFRTVFSLWQRKLNKIKKEVK